MKFRICYILLCVLVFLPTPFKAKSENASTTCGNGAFSEYTPFNSVPTYDYGPDGLVRFHISLTPDGWLPMPYYYSTYFRLGHYSADCEKLRSDQVGGSIPVGVSYVLIKAIETSPGWYSFESYNEDTGEMLAASNSFPPPFSEPIVEFSAYIPHGASNIYGYYERGVWTPIVPVKDPNFVASKTPVLIIPGTLGTEIDKGSLVLWPNINKMFEVSPIHSDDFMDPLGFNNNGTALDSSLTLNNILGEPHPTYDYSKSLVEDFGSQQYEINKNLFSFPYDWRDDIAKNANVFLKEKIDNILASSTASKIDIIAHSQGGLLIKRLLYDKPEYQAKINKLVFVGTPNLGSPKSAKILVYGDDLSIKKYGLGLDPLEIKKISQNMPSIYQMLPSKEYFNHSTGYLGQYKYGPVFTSGEIATSFVDTTSALKRQVYNLNSNLVDSANTFHSADFDNFSVTDSGIKAFNIMGCESPTIDQIYINGSGGKSDLHYGPGDGTVPIVSASNIPGAQNFYVLNNAEIHGTMLTSSGIRQKIVNLIADVDLPTEGKITTNPALCVFKGRKVEVHSPVDLHIYDENGNHVGLNTSGGFDYQIESVTYDEIGHDKYAFLPDDGHIYNLKLSATGSGVFNFYSSLVDGNQTNSVAYYNDVSVSTSSVAQILLNNENNQTINFTSDSRIVQPSSILNPNQSQDLVPPISTSTITGTLGTPGFYRSNVSVFISAVDHIIPGHENETSGVLKTVYSLDGGEYLVYGTSTPITVSAEGQHTLSFYSTDRAGNNEPEQSISFVIDKTAPELSFSFNPQLKDLEFIATDTLPSIITATSTSKNIKIKLPKFPPLRFQDSDNVITATDPAGNTTKLILKDKDRKHLLKAEIKSLTYNGQPADMSKTKLNFAWDYDKKGNLCSLLQNIQSKRNFNITALYNGKKTTLAGIDAKGVILKSLNGLISLKAFTNKGDLDWGY
ncbi:MAG: hypothetical protein KIH89_001845 [Candidatus Shapirobacteria bacterium]|nr:hypothetical protein [Candidatus Shapirobacteria bacterium]